MHPDKGPGGIAIIVGSKDADAPGVSLPNDFLKGVAPDLKEGDEGTITFKFKVAEKDDENTGLELTKAVECSAEDKAEDTDSDDDDMESRFNKEFGKPDKGQDDEHAEYD